MEIVAVQHVFVSLSSALHTFVLDLWFKSTTMVFSKTSEHRVYIYLGASIS
jgi:hypothetical protein